MFEFELDRQYRIYRVDSRNLTIQKKCGKKWSIISYHGNSLKSLISGVSELITSKCTPEAENIRHALEEAQIRQDFWLAELAKQIERLEALDDGLQSG